MKIDCEFKVVQWKNDLGKFYTCIVKSASITKPNTKIKGFNGRHIMFKSNNDVEAVMFLNTKVNYFPRNLSAIFPNLSVLKIAGCEMKSIARRDLTGLGNITSFDLSWNELESLPDDLFTDTPNLTMISFLCNDLTCLSSKLLNPIINNDLDLIDFRHNLMICGRYCTDCCTETIELLYHKIDAKCDKPIGNKQNFAAEITSGLKKLWNSDRFSDFVIVANRDELKKFSVHKNILSIQSSVFSKIFYHDMIEERTNEMWISEFSSETVEEFLRYFYTGEVKSEVNVMEMFAIAAKYDVSTLMFITKETVLDNLDETNAYEIFTLGHLYSSEEMKLSAFNEMKSMFTDKELTDDLIDKPEQLKIIAAKRILDNKKKNEDKIVNELEKKIKDLMEIVD